MPKRNDYIVIQEPMISVLGLSGVSLLVFAVIHGFTKDGEQHYRAFPEDLMRWTGASDRTIDAVLKKLREFGYINRRPVTYRGKSTFEYWTNYEDLLERVAAGEALQPYALYKKAKCAETAQEPSMQNLHTSDAETAHVGMQKLHSTYAETAHEPNNKVVKHTCKHTSKYLFHLDAADQVGPIRQEEKREFFRIFFEKNAADPAAQVAKFVNYYESLGWENADGRRYDTPKKRRGLAWMWECKGSAPRLTADYGTVKDKENQAAANRAFLKMLGELYELAACAGDPEDPTKLLDPSSRCMLSWKDGGRTYDLIWSGQALPVDWYDRHPEAAEITKKHFSKMGSVIFNLTS